MKIGIIELDVPNHYLAVNAIAKIYLVHPETSVTIFTTRNIEALLKPMFREQTNRVKFIVYAPGFSVVKMLHTVNESSLDRIHISSLFAHFKEFAHNNFNCPVYLGLHNDYVAWFYPNIFSGIRVALKRCHFLLNRDLIYKLRKTLIQQLYSMYYRKVFLKKLFNGKSKIVVYGPNVKRALSKYCKSEDVLEFPFAIYEEGFVDAKKIVDTQKLSIVIPGIVNNNRRDYFGLFDALFKSADNKSKKQFELILLGKIDLGSTLLSKVKTLQSLGFCIRYFTEYIDEETYSSELNRAQLILGNPRISKNGYGIAGETGILYNMIRSAKPGLMPKSFNIFPSLRSSTIFYSSFDDVVEKIIELSSNQNKLQDLASNAIFNAKKYTSIIWHKNLNSKEQYNS